MVNPIFVLKNVLLERDKICETLKGDPIPLECFGTMRLNCPTKIVTSPLIDRIVLEAKVFLQERVPLR